MSRPSVDAEFDLQFLNLLKLLVQTKGSSKQGMSWLDDADDHPRDQMMGIEASSTFGHSIQG